MVKKKILWQSVLASILIVPLFILAGFCGVFYDHGDNSVYAKQEWNTEEQAIADQTFLFLNFQEANLSAYNEAEQSHLEDVQNRFQLLYTIIAVLFVALLILVFTVKKKRDLFQNMLFHGGLGTLSVIVLLAILAFIDFSWFWTQFHYIAFPNGNWAFPQGSTLIRLFPEQFFYNFAISFILAIGSYGLAAILIGYIWKRRF